VRGSTHPLLERQCGLRRLLTATYLRPRLTGSSLLDPSAGRHVRTPPHFTLASLPSLPIGTSSVPPRSARSVLALEMASDIEMDEAEAAEWRAGLQVGDLIDGVGYLPRAKWAVAEIIDTTPTHFQLHFVHWGTEYNLDVERTSARIQPSGSRTKGAYTGHPLMERYVAEMATVPLLEAVPLHPHQLQRHEFECSYICDGCQARNDPDKPTSIYNCLMCHFGLCTRCFLGAGGVDPNPPPCERPVPLTRLKTFQTVEFVEDLKEYECAVCLSAAFTPIVLPGCGQ
jgi:hypothetical protein